MISSIEGRAHGTYLKSSMSGFQEKENLGQFAEAMYASRVDIQDREQPSTEGMEADEMSTCSGRSDWRVTRSHLPRFSWAHKWEIGGRVGSSMTSFKKREDSLAGGSCFIMADAPRFSQHVVGIDAFCRQAGERASTMTPWKFANTVS